MQIPTEALEVYRIAQKPGGSPSQDDLKLACVHIDGDKAVATDRSLLVQSRFEANGSTLKEPQNVPREVVDLAIRQGKGRKGVSLELFQEEDGPTFYASTEEEKEGTVLRFHSPTSKFVDYQAVISSKLRDVRNVVLDPDRLFKLAQLAKKQGASTVHLYVGARLFDPIEFRWDTGVVQTVAILAPMSKTDPAEPPGAEPPGAEDEG